MLTVKEILALLRKRGLKLVWSEPLQRAVLRGDRTRATDELLEVLRLRRAEMDATVAPREYLYAFGMVGRDGKTEDLDPLAWRTVGLADDDWQPIPARRSILEEIGDALRQRGVDVPVRFLTAGQGAKDAKRLGGAVPSP